MYSTGLGAVWVPPKLAGSSTGTWNCRTETRLLTPSPRRLVALNEASAALGSARKAPCVVSNALLNLKTMTAALSRSRPRPAHENHAATPKSSQPIYFIEISLRDCGPMRQRQLGRSPLPASLRGEV